MNKRRVLIVDDEPHLSALVQIYLEKLGAYEVMTVNFPSRALGAARTFAPDIILMDVNMPGKDGGEVSGEIRADKNLSTIPILFLTSLVSSSEAGEREIRRGTQRYLSKPVNPTLLPGIIERIIREGCVTAE